MAAFIPLFLIQINFAFGDSENMTLLFLPEEEDEEEIEEYLSSDSADKSISDLIEISHQNFQSISQQLLAPEEVKEEDEK